VQRLRAVVLLIGLTGLWACGPDGPEAAREGFIPLAAGGRLYYRLSGVGHDTIVVLHGGPGLHGRYLDDVVAPLASGHVFIIYDQRGRGRSDFPRDTLDLSAAADVADLDVVRTYFHLDRPTLIGHGWGAGLAALYAMRYPERVGRLLLISPMVPRANHLFNLTFQHAVGIDTSALDDLMTARIAGRDRSDPVGFCRRYWGAFLSPAVVRDRMVIRRLESSVCDAPPTALLHVELINRRVLGSLGAWNWPPQLTALQIPTLVIQGGESAPGDRDESLTWLASAMDWTSSLPDARLLRVGNTPQFPWLDAGDRFLSPVEEFLDGRWPREAHAVSPADSLHGPVSARD